jgi:hypothetical protein
VVGFKEAFELEIGFVIKCNGIQIFDVQSGFPQDIANGIGGEARVMLNAAEPFFMSPMINTAALSW